MKKLLLTLATAVCAIFGVSADVVIDFSEVSAQDKSAQAVVSGVTLNFSPTGKAYLNKGYVFLTGNGGDNPAQVSFTIDKEATAMILTTTGGCSTNAGNKVTVYAGETCVAEDLAVNVQNNEYVIQLNGAGVANTTYRLVATGSKNPQFAKITLVEPTEEVKLATEQKSLDFVTVLGGFQTKTVKLMNSNLTEDITVTYSNGVFSGPATVEKDATEFDVEFTAMAAGSYEGTLTLKSGDLEAEVSLTAFMAAHMGEEDDPLTVEDVFKMHNGDAGPFYVKGTIASYGAANAVEGMVGEGEPAVSNIVLVDGDYKIGVQLQDNDFRVMLNIVSTPENAGKEVLLKAKLIPYFGAPGLQSISYAEIVGGTGEEPEEELLAAPVVVVDGTNVETTLVGDAYVGEVHVDKEKGDTVSVSFLAETGAWVYYGIGELEEENIAAGNMYMFGFSVKESCSVVAYCWGYDANKGEDVFSKNVRVNIHFDKVNGVEALDGADAEAAYFDMAGRRVENPAKGIYVKVANGKATKVNVK